MDRPSSNCDFCGAPQVSNTYPSGRDGIDWYACPDCAALIEKEDWKQVVRRGIGAHAKTRLVPNGEEWVLRKQAEALVSAFRASHPLPV